LRDWLLGDDADEAMLARIAPGITPEMAAAVSKIMRIQDLVLVARKCRVVTRFPQYHRPARHPVDPAAAEPPA
jgi:ethanolamine ammonia-lyase large subunit